MLDREAMGGAREVPAVTVSTPTPFHLFHLAGQLRQNRALAALLTGVPRAAIEPGLRPFTRTACLPVLAERYGSRFLRGSAARELSWWSIEEFDRSAARLLPDCDVVVALSGRGLHTIREARRRGIAGVCDRGSTHIRWQDAVLQREHERFGLPYQPVDPRGMEKEEAEYEEADAITVPSSQAKRTYDAHGVRSEKVHVVPYGVDLSVFSPASNRLSRFRVLFVGQLRLGKGLHVLLDGVGRLATSAVEVVLVGARTNQTKEILRRTRVEYLLRGTMATRALVQEYRSTSVLVLPSLDEGFGLVMAEAMACGVPVIATSATGAEDLFTDGVEGYIVPPGDAEAIAVRLDAMMANESLRETMGRAALLRARSVGGWEDYGRRALEVYESLVLKSQGSERAR